MRRSTNCIIPKSKRKMPEQLQARRGKKELLRVTFPDGKVICYNKATYTFIASLAELSDEQLEKIDFKMNRLQILSHEVYPRLEKYMKPVREGWYINIQSDTYNKYRQLQIISDQLGIGLKVEKGSDFETEVVPNGKKQKKERSKLLVKFPDGEYVAEHSALETFLQTIWKLGIEAVMRKGIAWGGHTLITSAQFYRGQVQIGKNRWIIVPNTTNEKVRLLNVIAATLRVKLEITII